MVNTQDEQMQDFTETTTLDETGQNSDENNKMHWPSPTTPVEDGRFMTVNRTLATQKQVSVETKYRRASRLDKP